MALDEFLKPVYMFPLMVVAGLYVGRTFARHQVNKRNRMIQEHAIREGRENVREQSGYRPPYGGEDQTPDDRVNEIVSLF